VGPELFSVAGQVALIAGGSRGIGYAIAQSFAEAGAKVVITGRKQDTIEAAARKISQENPGALPVEGYAADVSVVEDNKRLVAEVVSRHGRIDTLFNVAGVTKRQPTLDQTEADYDHILGTNLKGAFFLSQEVGRHMIAARKGSQINIASYNNYSPLPGVTPYAVSKGGLHALTRSLAVEWGRYNVRVNSLAPGFILTALSEKLWSIPKMRDWVLSITPMRRLGTPEDLIGTAIYLASEASAFVTGQILWVGGGVTAGTNWPMDL
jgi:gluconate 5-dehydrogenase